MLSLALVISLIACRPVQAGAQANDPVKQGNAARQSQAVHVQKNVEYGREGGELLLLDLYAPTDDKPAPRPGIVFIHGGGWSGGDKAEFADKAKEMAETGYVAISVNYRLAPKFIYPAAVEDVQRAVRWLRSRGAELHLDGDRIGAMGASAGGHLAAMLGVTDSRDRGTAATEPSSRVRCVVDYFGRMDLNLEPTGTGFTDYRPGFIGRPKTEAPDLFTEASPITHVDSKTVPFLMVHGTRDTQVEPAQSIRMLAALEKVNVEATLVLLGNERHGFTGPLAHQAWDTAKAFLARHLQKGVGSRR